MRLAMIAAQSQNRVIGNNNKLPWYLPEDLKYFKRVTLGKPIIMGRKTFESIGRPLPGRTNIVITRNPDWTHDGAGVRVVHSLQQAIELAESLALVNGFEESLVIGGAEIYALALPQADRLYLTQVHAEVQGDAHFPPLDPTQWQEMAREDFSAIEPNPYDYSFIVLDRAGGKTA
ncbi:dihydrofolate reductase [Marinobacterium sp. MBR-111]|jgi:dihydrofolate reductase|uniref:Dihydrofolate reductase n=1 Tax=Marinobacterium iners DSM 11526 TaxID=1122198 RepID=A0A1H4E0Q7_9GAMM|nr:dihydrofolate reductase [Marinobacterium iners]SEA78387.1 dihydrofolate reductase [Marinobacterium iners DSM 11526]